jgi:hypothetical protein
MNTQSTARLARAIVRAWSEQDWPRLEHDLDRASSAGDPCERVLPETEERAEALRTTAEALQRCIRGEIPPARCRSLYILLRHLSTEP